MAIDKEEGGPDILDAAGLQVLPSRHHLDRLLHCLFDGPVRREVSQPAEALYGHAARLPFSPG